MAGDKPLGEEIMRIKSEIFARRRDIPAFKRDAYAMFERLKSERFIETDKNIWRSKLRHGGLMEADYMRSCLFVTETPLSVDFEAAIEDWNDIQCWERLLGLKSQPIKSTPARFAQDIGAKTLKRRQEKLEKTVKKVTHSFFKEVDPLNIPAPSSIVWKD